MDAGTRNTVNRKRGRISGGPGPPLDAPGDAAGGWPIFGDRNVHAPDKGPRHPCLGLYFQRHPCRGPASRGGQLAGPSHKPRVMCPPFPVQSHRCPLPFAAGHPRGCLASRSAPPSALPKPMPGLALGYGRRHPCRPGGLHARPPCLTLVRSFFPTGQPPERVLLNRRILLEKIVLEIPRPKASPKWKVSAAAGRLAFGSPQPAPPITLPPHPRPATPPTISQPPVPPVMYSPCVPGAETALLRTARVATPADPDPDHRPSVASPSLVSLYRVFAAPFPKNA